jgi:hypothetical protein
MGVLTHALIGSDIKNIKNPDKKKAKKLQKERMKPPGGSAQYTGRKANTPVTPTKPGVNQNPIMGADTLLGG